jgi:hypothetical protein
MDITPHVASCMKAMSWQVVHCSCLAQSATPHDAGAPALPNWTGTPSTAEHAKPLNASCRLGLQVLHLSPQGASTGPFKPLYLSMQACQHCPTWVLVRKAQGWASAATHQPAEHAMRCVQHVKLLYNSPCRRARTAQQRCWPG